MTGFEDCGKRVKQIRKALRLRQVDFAKELNMSGPSLSELETGKYKPGFDAIVNLASKFNVNLYFLLFGEGEMFREEEKTEPGSLLSTRGNREDISRFLFYFERSSIVHYHVLSSFMSILQQDRANIEREIKEFEGKRDREEGT